MPLATGYGRTAISKNIKLLRKEGRKPRQAVAIALSEARRSAKRAGKRPRHLFGTPSAKRYLRKRHASHARRR